MPQSFVLRRGLPLLRTPSRRARFARRRIMALGAFLGLALLALWALWRGRLALPAALAAVLFAYLLVGSQWFNPWYLLWLIPVAVLAPDASTRILALGFALLAPLTYLLQYDARLVVPFVFVPTALLAVRFGAALGFPGRSPLPLTPSPVRGRGELAPLSRARARGSGGGGSSRDSGGFAHDDMAGAGHG